MKKLKILSYAGFFVCSRKGMFMMLRTIKGSSINLKYLILPSEEESGR